jgi:hypothetical protein
MLFTTEKPVKELSSSYVAYVSYSDVVTDWGTSSAVASVAQKVFAQSPNLLAGGGQLLIAPLNEEEKLADGITRLSQKVYFGGVISAQDLSDEDAISASDTCQALDTIFVLPSNTTDALKETGVFGKISSKGNYKTKCLLYTGESKAVDVAGAYISRGFAVNFDSQNSCITMNLKDLSGVEVDSNISQNIFNDAQKLGVDLYSDIEGVAKVISNSNGQYFDELLNRMWFRLKCKVTYFNTLAGTSTKIPQTEAGMNVVKSALRKVCELAVTNGFLAAGTWNGNDKFGNVEDFVRNISDYGFYIYSAPVSEQSQTDRTARKAPVIQIAGKEAGAIHSADLIVSFEA